MKGKNPLNKAQKLIEDTKEEGKIDEESLLLRDAFNNLGWEDSLNPQQEISGLGFNESQFQGIGDDSQYNDIFEISAFGKQTIIDKFADYDTPKEESILMKK